MSKWQISNGVFELVGQSNTIVPSAEDVYAEAIEESPPVHNVSIVEAGTKLGVSFSPYPATASLVLGDPVKGGFPTLRCRVETQFGETESVSLTALKAGHVVIKDTWYPFDTGETETLLGHVSEDDMEAEELRSFHAVLKLKKLALETDNIIDETSEEGISTLAFVEAGDDNPPVGIDATLYPYQLTGWNWLRFLIGQDIGALLADEMGLGKTLQVISVIVDPHDHKIMAPSLIVAPGSLLENWRREFEKFAPSVTVLKHQGRDRTGRPADLEDYDVIITSYDTVVRDQSLLMMMDWRVIVADEAQNIKNPDALRTRSIKLLPRQVALAMTGTPIENRLEDLWSVMDFAVPEHLGAQQDFQEQFANTIDGAARLEPIVSPLMLRRRVADVAKDLPPRIEVPQVLEMSDEEADNYDRIRQQIVEQYGNVANLVALTSLRQYCAHPALLEPDIAQLSEFTKIERLREILDEIFAQGEKVIIFTSYTAMADRIAEIVQEDYGFFAACLDGRLAIDDRQPLIDGFSDITGAAALVLNPRAGGAGLNITAANHVIHYNLEWNPALEDQASARSHRRGQTLPVTVHRLFFAGTVEEVVNDRIQRKRALSDTAVVGVEGQQDDLDDILAALQASPVRKSK